MGMRASRCGNFRCQGSLALIRGSGGSKDIKKVSVEAAPVAALQDTVGAGDTFCATLVATLFRSGKLSSEALSCLSPAEVEVLLMRASCAAALNCASKGCQPPCAEELDLAVA